MCYAVQKCKQIFIIGKYYDSTHLSTSSQQPMYEQPHGSNMILEIK